MSNWPRFYGRRVDAGRERQLLGLDYLQAVTELLQRNRRMHPTAGLYEAADLQWWWRTPRSTDAVPQLLWFDEHDRPTAAAILTAWKDATALDTMVLADATPEWTAHVVERGLEHASRLDLGPLIVDVGHDDDVRSTVLREHGFEEAGESVTECWMRSDGRPVVSSLADGFRLTDRAGLAGRPHHMIGRSGPDVERRLGETSLYRDDLDLVVLDHRDEVAAYGLFWFDPITATGLVEPMRTEDAHGGKGLARHVLTAGLHRLAAAGADRTKICFEPDNGPARHLYLDVGFVPTRESATFRRRAVP